MEQLTPCPGPDAPLSHWRGAGYLRPNARQRLCPLQGCCGDGCRSLMVGLRRTSIPATLWLNSLGYAVRVVGIYGMNEPMVNHVRYPSVGGCEPILDSPQVLLIFYPEGNVVEDKRSMYRPAMLLFLDRIHTCPLEEGDEIIR